MDTTMVNAMRRNVIVDTDHGYGSGVIIGKDTVLTCFHCLEVGSGIRAGVKKDELVTARVLHVDPENDLCLLEVPTSEIEPIELNVEPKQFQVVYYVGNPHGHLALVSPGYILKVEAKVLLTNTLAMRGASGGGLFDLEGRLIGLTVHIEGDEKVGYPLVHHIKAAVIGAFLVGYIKAGGQ